jgi:hypothetical protein
LGVVHTLGKSIGLISFAESPGSVPQSRQLEHREPVEEFVRYDEGRLRGDGQVRDEDLGAVL